ncbi:hypothetical protein PLICRDRAFT_458484 [Plicaturopsis crispa FD-325 SS-3]|nr:hypothetical protein PLICRDRAFT_458484 [Plicaturopsis crispa FD-325 SS-3]
MEPTLVKVASREPWASHTHTGAHMPLTCTACQKNLFGPWRCKVRPSKHLLLRVSESDDIRQIAIAPRWRLSLRAQPWGSWRARAVSRRFRIKKPIESLASAIRLLRCFVRGKESVQNIQRSHRSLAGSFGENRRRRRGVAYGCKPYGLFRMVVNSQRVDDARNRREHSKTRCTLDSGVGVDRKTVT